MLQFVREGFWERKVIMMSIVALLVAAFGVSTADSSSASVLACTVIRGNDNDNIRDGTNGCDDIATFRGQDISRAKDGADLVHMGRGADGATGGRDQDEMYGEDGDDFLGGGRGDDDLNDSAGTDVDIQCGNEGDDNLSTADGDDNDAMVGGSGVDILYDGADNDFKEVGTDPNCDDGAGLLDSIIGLGDLPDLDGLPDVTSQDLADESGYLFSNVSVDAPDSSSNATVNFDWVWPGEDYPGWRECVITLTDASGTTALEEHRLFVGSAPSYTEDSIRVDLSSATGTPSDGVISCLPGRVDDPSQHYVISDVKMADRNESLPLAILRRTALVSFDARWSSAGQSGVEMCFVRVLDREGLQLAARSFDFMAASGASNDVRVPMVLAKPIRDQSRVAEVSCE